MDYRQMAAQAAARAGIPANLFLGLVKQESGFNPNARSGSGALGLTQLMPQTARGLGVKNPYSPAENLAAGAKYLSDQYRHFGRWDLALAAYNAGPGAVQKYGGVPPYAETQNYVRSIMANAKGGGGGGGGGAGGGGAAPAPMMGGAPMMGAPMGDARQAFVQQMVSAIGMTGQQRSNATMGAILGLRRGLADQTRQMSQMQQMRSAMSPQPTMAPTSAPQAGPVKLALVDGVPVDMGVARQVSQVAQLFGVTPTSGYRSPGHNKAVGGAENSDHLRGDAVDFSGSPAQMARLYSWALAQGFPYVEPMSQAKNHVHISFKR